MIFEDMAPGTMRISDLFAIAATLKETVVITNQDLVKLLEYLNGDTPTLRAQKAVLLDQLVGAIDPDDAKGILDFADPAKALLEIVRGSRIELRMEGNKDRTRWVAQQAPRTAIFRENWITHFQPAQ